MAEGAHLTASGGLSRAALGVVIGAAILTGCDDAPAPPPASTAPILVAPSATPPRRPARRYYLARTSDRCEIFSQDGDDRTDPFATPCPQLLEVGERIRIVGKTCLLENTAHSERAKPVVCPDPLTRFEKELRAAGD